MDDVLEFELDGRADGCWIFEGRYESLSIQYSENVILRDVRHYREHFDGDVRSKQKFLKYIR